MGDPSTRGSTAGGIVAPPAPGGTATHALKSAEAPIKLRPADLEMARVLNTEPLQIAGGVDPLQAVIAHWNHGALHDVVEPMTDHVIMTYIGTFERLERRSGRSYASGMARAGAVTIIPAGSSARWDIAGNVDVVQLYLKQKTLERIATEAGHSTPNNVLERTGHPDETVSRLLMMANDAADGSASLDTLFRQQLTELVATRLLGSHTGNPIAPRSVSEGSRLQC